MLILFVWLVEIYLLINPVYFANVHIQNLDYRRFLLLSTICFVYLEWTEGVFRLLDYGIIVDHNSLRYFLIKMEIEDKLLNLANVRRV